MAPFLIEGHFTILIIIGVIYISLLIYYFTRPKVKNQFS